ncbi:cold shock domain-containing protein [Corallococcus sp. bb12-1]|uniref:cold-shock protein n=1 Tax=Corallococcus sp. bb12-1 TaxID=2996784 RepID=UPI00227055E0|nr:cold shock domain-containing protein [Corallococcus sp. bb12-1]MCY1047426.1 cold shock domain-containing protein [Corallococcus sp. bb12-1]
MRRRTGIVQWFNLAMGFGFIAPDRRGAHVVVLREDIEAEGDPILTRGQAVSFEYFTGHGRFTSNRWSLPWLRVTELQDELAQPEGRDGFFAGVHRFSKARGASLPTGSPGFSRGEPREQHHGTWNREVLRPHQGLWIHHPG